MKKTTISLLTGILMLVALCLFPFSAFAAEAVTASIPVEIEGGGTAVIITEVNCPLPEQSSIEVPNGTTENINIVFSEPGDYTYTIQADTEDGSYYSPAYYTVHVAVRVDSDGELTAMVVLTKADSDYKPDKCVFTRSEEPSDAPAAVSTGAVTPTQPSKDAPVSRPKTGDDNMLDIYLMICIAAAGGLFMLSVIYYVSTNRLIGRK